MTTVRAGFLSALPDIGIAGVFLVTWGRPSTFGPFMVRWLLLVLAFGVIYCALTGWSVITAHDWTGKIRTGAASFSAGPRPPSR